MKISDGAGKNGEVRVSIDQRLETNSSSVAKISTRSKENEDAYVWTSTYSATAGDEVLSVQNTSSSRILIITRIDCGAVNAAVFEALRVSSGTPAGTAGTVANLNINSSKTPDATSFGNASITGSVSGTSIGWISHSAASMNHIIFDGSLVLGTDDIAAVRYLTGTTGIVYVSLYGYFEDK